MYVVAVDRTRGILPGMYPTFESAWTAATAFLHKEGGSIWHSTHEECQSDQLSFNDAFTMNWAVGQLRCVDKQRPAKVPSGPTMIQEVGLENEF